MRMAALAHPRLHCTLYIATISAMKNRSQLSAAGCAQLLRESGDGATLVVRPCLCWVTAPTQWRAPRAPARKATLYSLRNTHHALTCGPCSSTHWPQNLRALHPKCLASNSERALANH